MKALTFENIFSFIVFGTLALAMIAFSVSMTMLTVWAITSII